MKNSNTVKQKTPKKNDNVAAILEDQPSPYIRLTVRSEGKVETHNLVEELRGAGWGFQRVPTPDEVERNAQQLAHLMLVKTAGEKLLKAIDSKRFWIRWWARFIWTH